MPVFNAAPFLAEACRSIFRQSFGDFEFLAVEDGSSDDSPALLDALAASEPRLRVIRQGRQGLVPALNRGLAEARAPLVARMDADDISAPERLARQVAHLDRHPGVVALGTGWRLLDGAGRERGRRVPPTRPEEVRAALARRNCLAHPAVMLRRVPVLALGGYREALSGAEDYDLWLRLAAHHDLANLAEPLLDLRLHPGQVTRRRLEEGILAEMAAAWLARCRAAGGEPPFDPRRPPGREGLARLGMPAGDLSAGIVARGLGAARDALALGDGATARLGARLVLAERPPRLRTRLHAAWLLARAAALRPTP